MWKEGSRTSLVLISRLRNGMFFIVSIVFWRLLSYVNIYGASTLMNHDVVVVIGGGNTQWSISMGWK
jgi:hypothetical protein